MKVYVVTISYPYEGSELDKVFATAEAANKYANKQEADDNYGPDYCVTEMEVEE